MAEVNKEKPEVKGVRTWYQSAIALVIGLAAAVWAVPGVPQAVQGYVVQYVLPGLIIGVPALAGGLSWLQNWWEDSRERKAS